MEVEEVNGVLTHVFSLTRDADRGVSRPLLMVVPGSPGMGHFYVPFATRLFQLARERADVCVVSHAGHSPGLRRSSCLRHFAAGKEVATPPPEGEETRDWFDLEDQVAHKMAYLEQRVRGREEVYLVGHSIGCYVILQMLELLSPLLVKKAVLLFPTIERMSETPNGQKLAPLFNTYRHAATSLVGLLSWCPEWLREFVLRQYLYTTPVEHLGHMTRALTNIDGHSMHNILCMAGQEMEEVAALPEDLIRQHIDKLVFYYGAEDSWTLKSCYQDMAKRFPDKDVHLCSHGYPHAFVLTASNEMAEFVFSRLPLHYCDKSQLIDKCDD